MANSQRTSESAEPTSSRATEQAKLLSNGLMAILGGLAAGLFVSLFTADWACTAISAAIMGCLVVGVLDGLARCISKRRPSFRWGRARQWVLVLLVAAVYTLGLRLLLNQADLFKEAFSIAPPEGVTDLRARAHYAGGPGDRLILIEFRSDAMAIRRIVAARGFAERTDESKLYFEGFSTWQQFWKSQMYLAEGYNHRWKSISPMVRPEVYRWESEGGGLRGCAFDMGMPKQAGPMPSTSSHSPRDLFGQT